MATQHQERSAVYVRRISGRACATFDSEQFWMAESREDESNLLARAGVSLEDLPCYATLPIEDEAICTLIHGA